MQRIMTMTAIQIRRFAAEHPGEEGDEASYPRTFLLGRMGLPRLYSVIVKNLASTSGWNLLPSGHVMSCKFLPVPLSATLVLSTDSVLEKIEIFHVTTTLQTSRLHDRLSLSA
jgi:hypothetical protein